jgi:hypothetical protein
MITGAWGKGDFGTADHRIEVTSPPPFSLCLKGLERYEMT